MMSNKKSREENMMTFGDLLNIMGSKKSDEEKIRELEAKKGSTKVNHKVRLRFGKEE
jgi:hypothetical protein